MCEDNQGPVWEPENFTSSIQEWITHLAGEALFRFMADEQGINEFYLFHTQGVQKYNPGVDADPDEVKEQLTELGERISDLLGIVHVQTICRSAPNTEEGYETLSSIFGELDCYVDEEADSLVLECVEASAVYGIGCAKAISTPVVRDENNINVPYTVNLLNYPEEVAFDEFIAGFLASRWNI